MRRSGIAPELPCHERCAKSGAMRLTPYCALRSAIRIQAGSVSAKRGPEVPGGATSQPMGWSPGRRGTKPACRMREASALSAGCRNPRGLACRKPNTTEGPSCRVGASCARSWRCGPTSGAIPAWCSWRSRRSSPPPAPCSPCRWPCAAWSTSASRGLAAAPSTAISWPSSASASCSRWRAPRACTRSTGWASGSWPTSGARSSAISPRSGPPSTRPRTPAR